MLLRLEKKTGKAPAALRRRPKYEFQYAFYRDGFRILHKGRRYGMTGPEHISYEAMTSYLNEFNLDNDARLMTIRIWQRMDAKLLEVTAQKRKSK